MCLVGRVRDLEEIIEKMSCSLASVTFAIQNSEVVSPNMYVFLNVNQRWQKQLLEGALRIKIEPLLVIPSTSLIFKDKIFSNIVLRSR